MVNKTGIIPLVVGFVAIGLEIYPKSAVISRVAAPGEHYINYYSYFSTQAFWLGNIFPLITAVLTCVVVVALIFSVFKAFFLIGWCLL